MRTCWNCQTSSAPEASHCPACAFRGAPTPLRFGQYQVEGYLGGGGFGQVWLCHQPALERHVAVKRLNAELQGRDEALEYARREMRVGGRLNHPHIVTVFDADPAQGWHVREFMAGRSLADALRERPEWVQQNRLRILREVAEALRAAHALRVLHRDVKPENILLDEDGHAKLADFGIARQLTSRNGAVTFAGTLPYMAPEVLDAVDGAEYGLDVDLHSLGVVYYQVLTGQLPFTGSLTALALSKQEGRYVPLPDIVPGVEPALADLIAALLAPPEQRIKSAAAVVDHLTLLDPTLSRGNSIDDLQRRLSYIFGRRNRNKDPLFLMAQLESALGGLVGGLLHPDPTYRRQRTEAYFPRAFAWLCAACTRFDVSLSQLLWLKYEDGCPYCAEAPCVCQPEARVPDDSRNRAILSRVIDKRLMDAPPPRTLAHYASVFRRIYGEKNRASGLEAVSRHTLSEHAEATSALLRIRSLDEMQEVTVLHLELADILAWFLALLNAYGDPDYNFNRSFDQLFADGCYQCRQTPCSCPEIETELRLPTWRSFA